MIRDTEIAGALATFVGSRISGNFTGRVTEVDKKNATVTVEFNGNRYVAKLRSIVDGQTAGLVLYPATGSQVFCVAEGNSSCRYYVAGYEKIEELVYTGGDMSVKINAYGVVFNGGNLGGLVKIAELKENLDSLKSYVEAMNSALPQAFTSVGAGAAAAGAGGAASYSGSMAGKIITVKDMENKKVKH